MYSSQDDLAAGFPHSEIRGSKAARASPRLIATCYVLHRLSVPRHPPNALNSLDPKQLILQPAASAHSALHNLDLLTDHKSFITPPSRRTSKTTCRNEVQKPPTRIFLRRPKSKNPRKTTCGQSMHPINNVKQQSNRPKPIGNSNTQILSRNPSPIRSHQVGGAERDRTDDLLLAKQALSQLSYSPNRCNGPKFWRLSRRAFGGPGKI
jgi:hypothetical protein